ncbi:hypothetical protein EMIT036CA2_40368 [Chryseobacterium sp. IT-36CA2]
MEKYFFQKLIISSAHVHHTLSKQIFNIYVNLYLYAISTNFNDRYNTFTADRTL